MISATPYEIYTKGYCAYDDVHPHGGIGAYAFIVVHDLEIIHTEVYEVPEYVNEFSMNLKAVNAALAYIEKTKHPQEKVVIYNDNDFFMKAYLKEWWRGWLKNGWLNFNGNTVAYHYLWQTIVPFFRKPRYRFGYPPKTATYFTDLCLSHAQQKAEQAKLKYYEKKRKQFYGTNTKVE